MKRATLFLIGGSGFVGKNIVKNLYTSYDIYIFDKFIDDVFFSKFENVKCYKVDLINEPIPNIYIDPDYIINLASIVTAERDLSRFSEMIECNLGILMNLYYRFNNSSNLKLFIQFGSAEEYGYAKSPYKESVREQPNSPYALAKQLTTNTVIMLYRNYNFPAVVVRPGNLYGPMQPKTKFLPYVEDCLKHNVAVEVTPCEQKRDFIHVDKLCDYLDEIMHNYDKCIGEIVNISSGKSISLKSMIENMRKILNSSSEIKYGAKPYREGEAMDLSCDISKLQNIINK